MMCAFTQPDQIQLQRLAEHLHQLGPRAIAEAIADALAWGDLDRLEAFRRLDAATLAGVQAAASIAEFPPRIVAVPRHPEGA